MSKVRCLQHMSKHAVDFKCSLRGLLLLFLLQRALQYHAVKEHSYLPWDDMAAHTWCGLTEARRESVFTSISTFTAFESPCADYTHSQANSHLPSKTCCRVSLIVRSGLAELLSPSFSLLMTIRKTCSPSTTHCIRSKCIRPQNVLFCESLKVYYITKFASVSSALTGDWGFGNASVSERQSLES